MKSLFATKEPIPSEAALKTGLGNTYVLWESLEKFTLANDPTATAQWHFSGEKFGWGYRIKDKKRVLIYLFPRDGFFKIAMVFGEKAMAQILASGISENLKTMLLQAKPYAEGRGIRIEGRDLSDFEDIKQLIKIKMGS